MKQEKQQILEARARALAGKAPSKAEAGNAFEIVEFALAGERYGIPTEFVREVSPLKDFAPIPCTPPFILGMMNVKGQILTLVNLARIFDLQSEGISDLNQVIILGGAEVEFGILADSIHEVRLVRHGELQPIHPLLTGARAELSLGVTHDRLIVIAASKLLSHESLIVREEATIQNLRPHSTP